MTEAKVSMGPLQGVRVLDLSRVLAGPWSTQVLGDLGADVIKIEQPGQGDDTRKWGPPFVDDGSRDAAYYVCANRNKRSIAVDMADPRGADVIRRLAADSDIFVENFRVGGLAKYGLDYVSLTKINPRLVYCSITGFGQEGPYKDRGGYDFLIQGMSGLMSVTGFPDSENGGQPVKVGIPICDLVTGLYASISILAALAHRDRTGEGQHIDMCLLDAQIALLANQASGFLNGGMIPGRMGNEHPNTVPYQDFECRDGRVLVALGNDRQFRDFMNLIGMGELASDPRFCDNGSRSANREALQGKIRTALIEWSADEFLAEMECAKLPAGRINDIPTMLADAHVSERGLIHKLQRSKGGVVNVIGYPGRFSETPASYRRAPPRTGEDTREVLENILGMDPCLIDLMITQKIVA